MAIPNQITDGSFATAVQNGPATWSRPFENVGDTQSFEYTAIFRQDASTYTPFSNSLNLVTLMELPVSITTSKGVAYLVSESETRSIECGLLEFSRTYASLPRTRYEHGTTIYSQQFYTATPEIEAIPLTLNARFKYEYSLTPPAQLYTNKVGVAFDTLYTYGDWTATTGTPVADGVEFLSEDSETTIYRGVFFQRKSVLATIAFTT